MNYKKLTLSMLLLCIVPPIKADPVNKLSKNQTTAIGGSIAAAYIPLLWTNLPNAPFTLKLACACLLESAGLLLGYACGGQEEPERPNPFLTGLIKLQLTDTHHQLLYAAHAFVESHDPLKHTELISNVKELGSKLPSFKQA